jgi:ABC-type dipeptide/oligopeptide/nickel transport system permease component
MNWERGFKRFAFVLAVLVGILHCILVIAYGGYWLDSFFDLVRLEVLPSPSREWVGLLIAFLMGFLPVWGIPAATCWAVRGFTEKDKSASQPSIVDAPGPYEE